MMNTNDKTGPLSGPISGPDSADGPDRTIFSTSVKVIFAGVMLVFIGGVITGLTRSVIESGNFSVLAGFILAAVALIGGGLIWWLIRQLRGYRDTVVAPSIARSHKLWGVFFVIGLLIGIPLVFFNESGTAGLFTNGPIDPIAAAVALFLWLIIAPIFTLAWWRSIDELEQSAYAIGANVAGHFYLFLAPSWWLATRAGWLPPQDPMIVLLMVAAIWSGVWLYKKNY